MRVEVSLEGKRKVAIVTGASSGIGEATARLLAANGFRVVLAARRLDHLNALCAEIQKQGGEAFSVETDLCDEDSTHQLVEKTLATYGRVDLLVNNAGYSPVGALEQLSRAQVRDTFEVNLFAGLQLISELIPVMRKQGEGRIVQISSLTSRVPAPLAVAYAGTKGGVEAALDCLGLELTPWKISVSTVIPGFVDTPAFDTAREAGELLRNDPQNIYRDLMFQLEAFANSKLEDAAQPEDVARAVFMAATARNPREVYFVPFSSRIFSLLFRCLPKRWGRRLLLKTYASSA